jgi:hypothetical protein
MYELTTWIDKKFEDVSKGEFFEVYFANIPFESIEDTYFLSNQLKGIDVTLTDKLIVKSIHLSSGSHSGNKQFKGELPFNLEFTMSRKMIQKLMGIPNITGGGFKDSLFGYINQWDKYLFDTFSLHLQYSNDESYIELLTIGSLEFEKNSSPE